MKKSQPKKNGQCPVMGRITIDGVAVQFSCKFEVDPKIWDADAGRATGRSEQARDANRLLDKIGASLTEPSIPKPTELSYFRLSLLSYLRESHPDRATDRSFIASRGDAGAVAYSEAIRAGHTHDEADEIAARTLYEGLHFSPYRTLVTILWDEFEDDIDPARAEGLAMELLPRLSAILKKYTFTDDFAGTSEYELLYTELTGAVQTLLDDGLL